MPYSLNQAAEICEVAKATISHAIKTGDLTAVKIRNQYAIDPAELMRWKDTRVPRKSTTEHPDSQDKIRYLEERLQSSEQICSHLKSTNEQLTTQIGYVRKDAEAWQRQAETAQLLLKDERKKKPWWKW